MLRAALAAPGGAPVRLLAGRAGRAVGAAPLCRLSQRRSIKAVAGSAALDHEQYQQHKQQEQQQRHPFRTAASVNAPTTPPATSSATPLSAGGAPASSEGKVGDAPVRLTTQQEALIALNENALLRGERPAQQIFFSSVLGGCFISWGATMYFTLAGGSPALSALAGPGFHRVATALVFPIGLSAITITSTDMVTSNMMFSSLTFVSRDSRRTTEEKVAATLRLAGISTAGNFVGALGMAYFASHLIAASPEATAFVTAAVVKKATMPLSAVFFKAVGCNWLVNLAVFQAQTAPTTPGKMAVLWLPITTVRHDQVVRS
jgi:formate/nitrite transporter FocA (FNT family)